MSGWLLAMMAAAAAAGLFGGVHCAAMCGGIVSLTSKPRHATSGQRLAHALAYNAGRVMSYVVAGALAGALGSTGAVLRGGAPMQQLAMFLMGVSLLIVALNLAGVRPVMRGIEAAGSVLWRRVQPLSRHWLPARSPAQSLALGAVWGWLPCGLVYATLLLAMSSGSAIEGALILAAFGAGTLPNLLLLHVVVRQLHTRLQIAWARYAASALIAAAGLYGMLHALQPAALDPASPFCRYLPGLADWLR